MTKPLNAADQAAAIAAAEAANAIKTANFEAAKALKFDAAKALGVVAAQGEGSLFELAMSFQDGIREGVLTAGESKALYDAYVAGFNSLAAEPMAESSAKVQRSIFATFGEPAAVAQGRDIYARVITIRKGIATEDRVGSAYSTFAKVNRELAALAKTVADVSTIKVDDDQLRGWCTKAAKVDADILDKLLKSVQSVAAVAKHMADDGELAKLVEQLAALHARRKSGVKAASDPAELIKAAA